MKQAYYASAAQAKDENSLPRPQRMRHASHIHTAASAHHHSLNSIKESVTCTVLRRWRAYAASLLSACLQSLLDDVDGRESHTSHHLHDDNVVHSLVRKSGCQALHLVRICLCSAPSCLLLNPHSHAEPALSSSNTAPEQQRCVLTLRPQHSPRRSAYRARWSA